jgi:predicted O-methyltransferase YrrM
MNPSLERLAAAVRQRHGFLAPWRAWRVNARFPVPRSIHKTISTILRTVDRQFCHPAKPRVLASLIVRERIQRTVEIGVYGGASFVAQAVAARHVGGLAIGIDPYSAAEAEQKDNRDRLDPLGDDLARRDWEGIYAAFLAMLDRYDLARWCRILRMTSTEAAPLIESGVGLIHIDGNHDRMKVEADLANYLPKLRPGGYLVIDDIGWTTIRPLYEELKNRMRLVYQAQDVWGCLRNE